MPSLCHVIDKQSNPVPVVMAGKIDDLGGVSSCIPMTINSKAPPTLREHNTERLASTKREDLRRIWSTRDESGFSFKRGVVFWGAGVGVGFCSVGRCDICLISLDVKQNVSFHNEWLCRLRTDLKYFDSQGRHCALTILVCWARRHLKPRKTPSLGVLESAVLVRETRAVVVTGFVSISLGLSSKPSLLAGGVLEAQAGV